MSHPHIYGFLRRPRLAPLVLLLGAAGLPAAHAQAPPVGVHAPPPLTVKPPLISVQTPPPFTAPAPPAASCNFTRVTVTGTVHIPMASVIAVLQDKGSPASISDLTAAVKGMGVFKSVVVTTSADPAGGTDVACTVVENPVVRAIKFTANTPDGQPTVPAAALIAHMQTAIGLVLNTNMLTKDEEALFNHDTGYVRAQGYLMDADSDVNIDPNSGVLTIPLVELFIDKIMVQGTGSLPMTDVLAVLRVKPGDLFDTSALQQGMTRVAAMRQIAEVSSSQFTPGEPGKGTLEITVRVTRGPFGTITPGGGTPVTVSYGGMLGGAVIIPVQINGKSVGHFLLISNTDLSGISSAFASANGLTPQPMLEGGQPYYVNGQPASSVSLDRLTLGGAAGVTVQSLSLPVADLSALSKQFGQSIDGILGADLLSRIAVGIDFPRRRVTFWDHGHLSAAERHTAGFDGATQVGVTSIDGSTPVLSAVARIQNGATVKEEPMFIATGNQTSLLPAAVGTGLGMTPLPNPNNPGIELSRADHLNFGGLSLNAPLFQLTESDSSTTLGLNILSSYRVLMDGPAGAAFFAPEVTVSGADPHRVGFEVPFRYDPLLARWPVVQVSINGHAPLPFLFDTGAESALTIDRQAAGALGLTVDGATALMINGSVPVQTAAVSTAVLQGRTPGNNVTISLEQAQVGDLGMTRDSVIGPPIVGIIGAGMLDDTAIHFDFSGKILTFFPRPADTPPGPGVVTLPLSKEFAERSYLATLTPSSGVPMRLLVDTGSGATNLSYEARKSLQPIRSAGTGEWMLGSMELGQYLLLPGLPYAGMPPGRLVIALFPTDAGPRYWYPATLGIDILSRLSVTLDIPHMRLLLGPPPKPVPQPHSGWVGIRLAQVANQFQITEVLPASPAARAGLKAGDRVLAVDGHSLTGRSLYNARILADGLASTPAAFLIQRMSHPLQTLRFRRADESGDPDNPLDGVYGRQEAKNPFIVSAVIPGCPAARAGMAAGDTITLIDGHLTQDLTTAQWQTLLLKTRLTLAVARDGLSRTVVLAAPPPVPSHGRQSGKD